MRRNVLLVALACLVALGGQSFAELCTIDAVPAATLLLPYFEVSLTPTEADPVEAERSVDTFFSVNNASAAATVAHVVLWGDWSLPSIDFDIFLTGYDVETVSLGALFNDGFLPITAHATNDPPTAGPDTDVISPHGLGAEGGKSENPQWDSFPDNPVGPLFPGCDANLPLGPNPVLTGLFADRVRCGHTGRGLECGDVECIGQVHDETGVGGNDFIARGYITIDNVIDCNLRFPNDATGYFGTDGVASNVNQLWGDWFIVQDGRAIGDNLVAIEADPDGMAFTPGDYTFYGRYVGGLGTDQREPLASTWATRYFSPDSVFDGGASLFVWRDSKCQTAADSFGPGCSPESGKPPWWPLDETQVVAFDTQEDACEICTDLPGSSSTGVSPPIIIEDDPQQCFRIETGRYRVGEDNLLPPFSDGWMYLNLNFTLGDTGGICETEGLFGDIAQSWINTELDSVDLAGGALSVGFAGTQLTSACSSANPVIVGDLGN